VDWFQQEQLNACFASFDSLAQFRFPYFQFGVFRSNNMCSWYHACLPYFSLRSLDHLSLAVCLQIKTDLWFWFCRHAYANAISHPPQQNVIVWFYPPIKDSRHLHLYSPFAFVKLSTHEYLLPCLSARPLPWCRRLFGFRGPLFRLEVRVIIVGGVIMRVLECRGLEDDRFLPVGCSFPFVFARPEAGCRRAGWGQLGRVRQIWSHRRIGR